MSERRRALMTRKGDILPPGYKRVGYIKNADRYGAYLMIPFSFNSSMDFELAFVSDFTVNNFVYMYSGTTETAAVLIYGTGNDVGVRIGGTAYRSGVPISNNDEHIITLKGKKLYLDGTIILDVSDKPDFIADRISLYGYLSSRVYTGTSAIVKCNISRNSSSLFKGVVCLDANNRPCMYDTVSGQTFYNAGTGEFQYGGII